MRTRITAVTRQSQHETLQCAPERSVLASFNGRSATMRKPQAAVAALLLALSGCAAVDGQLATDSEQILAQAGFRRETAPAGSAAGAISAAPQALKVRQLTAETQNGTTTYEFYDPEFCRCAYLGGPKEYAELQRLRQARAAEHQQLLRATLSGTSDPDPNLWGPWNPEGLDVK